MALSTFIAPVFLNRATKAPQRGILRRIKDWQDYRRLSQMEDYRLRDIGLTRDQVHAARWDAPHNWRQE